MIDERSHGEIFANSKPSSWTDPPKIALGIHFSAFFDFSTIRHQSCLGIIQAVENGDLCENIGRT